MKPRIDPTFCARSPRPRRAWAVIALMMGCGAATTGPTVGRERADAAPVTSEPVGVEPVVVEPEPPVQPPGPPPLAGPAPAHGVAVGAESSCSVSEAGVVRCWGSNRFGQLGRGLPVGYATHADPAVVDLPATVRVVSGLFHACAITTAADVYCWGHNAYGQLGDGSRTDAPRPVQVAGLSDVVALGLGLGHTCALRDDRSVWCWGRNHMGQLGDGTTIERVEPARVPALEAQDVVAGRAHTCALSDGAAVCWGENLDGQLGTGDRAEPLGYRPTPAVVEGTEVVSQMSAAGGSTCVLSEEDVRCWGRNDSGQLGVRPSGRPTTSVPSATVLPGSGDAIEVRAGSRFTCVRFEDGHVGCLGLGHFGQLGDGQRRARRSLVRVRDLPEVSALSVAVHHACAVSGDEVFCWGADRRAQLGDGEQRRRGSATAVRVHELEAVEPPPEPPVDASPPVAVRSSGG